MADPQVDDWTDNTEDAAGATPAPQPMPWDNDPIVQPAQSAAPAPTAQAMPWDNDPIEQPAPQPSDLAPFVAKRVARSVLPTAGAIGGAIPGAALGAEAGAPLAPFTFGLSVPAGALIGGAAGGFVGGATVGEAQNWLLEKLGLVDDRQDAADDAAHPVAGVLADLAPSIAAFGTGVGQNLPKIARAGGALLQGGFEAAQEKIRGEDFDPSKIAAAAGFGAVFAAPRGPVARYETAVRDRFRPGTPEAEAPDVRQQAEHDATVGGSEPPKANTMGIAPEAPPPNQNLESTVGNPDSAPERSERDYKKDQPATPSSGSGVTIDDAGLGIDSNLLNAVSQSMRVEPNEPPPPGRVDTGIEVPGEQPAAPAAAPEGQAAETPTAAQATTPAVETPPAQQAQPETPAAPAQPPSQAPNPQPNPLREVATALAVKLPKDAVEGIRQPGVLQNIADTLSNGKVDREHEVPYLAGRLDNGGIAVDRRVPPTIEFNGRQMDPAVPLTVHEYVEAGRVDQLKQQFRAQNGRDPTPEEVAQSIYPPAHSNAATPAEKAVVDHFLGPSGWEHYTHVMDGLIDGTEHERITDPPPNLALYPYPDALRAQLERRGVAPEGPRPPTGGAPEGPPGPVEGATARPNAPDSAAQFRGAAAREAGNENMPAAARQNRLFFEAAFANVHDSVRIAAEDFPSLERAGAKFAADQLPREKMIQWANLITQRVRAMLREFPGDPATSPQPEGAVVKRAADAAQALDAAVRSGTKEAVTAAIKALKEPISDLEAAQFRGGAAREAGNDNPAGGGKPTPPGAADMLAKGNKAAQEGAGQNASDIRERVRNAYEEIKRENGGISGAFIGDVQERTGIPLAELHDYLAKEAKAGRLTVHPSTSVDALRRRPFREQAALTLGDEKFHHFVLKDNPAGGSKPTPPGAADMLAKGKQAAAEKAAAKEPDEVAKLQAQRDQLLEQAKKAGIKLPKTEAEMMQARSDELNRKRGERNVTVNGKVANSAATAERINKSIEAARSAMEKFPPPEGKEETAKELRTRLTAAVNHAIEQNDGKFPQYRGKEPALDWLRRARRLIGGKLTGQDRKDFIASEYLANRGAAEEARSVDATEASIAKSRRSGDEAVAAAEATQARTGATDVENIGRDVEPEIDVPEENISAADEIKKILPTQADFTKWGPKELDDFTGKLNTVVGNLVGAGKLSAEKGEAWRANWAKQKAAREEANKTRLAPRTKSITAFHGSPETFSSFEMPANGDALHFTDNKQLASSPRYRGDTGSVYKVDLAMKPGELLDLDRTVGEQPRAVQDKLAAMGFTDPDMSGFDVYGARKAADFRQAGIPGAQRAVGNSHTYFVFDPGRVQITERNGKAGGGEGRAPAPKPPAPADRVVQDDELLKEVRETVAKLTAGQDTPAAQKARSELAKFMADEEGGIALPDIKQLVQNARANIGAVAKRYDDYFGVARGDRALVSDALNAFKKSRDESDMVALGKQLDTAHNFWEGRNPGDAIAYFGAAERNDAGNWPSFVKELTDRGISEDDAHDMYAFHPLVRKLLDQAHKLEAMVGSTADYIENYMPHMFEGDAKKFREWVQQQYVDRLGANWFTKVRGFDVIDDALKAGFKLRYRNPMDAISARIRAGIDSASIMDILNMGREQGIAVTEKEANAAKGRYKDWVPYDAPFTYNDSIRWRIAPEAAPIWHNALKSTGLWQEQNALGSAFRMWMHAKAVWAPVKLSLSAFHPIHLVGVNLVQNLVREMKTALMTSQGLPGVAKALGKGTLQGLTDPLYAAKIPDWVPYLGTKASQFEGKSILDIMKKPDAERTDNESAWAQLINETGTALHMSHQDRYNASQAMRDAFANSKYLRGAGNAAIAAFQKLSLQNATFNYWIPNLKGTQLARGIAAALERDPSLVHDQPRRMQVLRDLGKSVDDRYGEMFYNSLFWNKMAKDIGTASFLSLSWNLGQVRQAGGAIADIAKGRFRGTGSPYEQLRYKQGDRIPYTLAYMGTMMGAAGLISYAATGQIPSGLDWFFPRAGGTNPDGSPRRYTTSFNTRELPMAYYHIQEENSVLNGLWQVVWNKMVLQPITDLLSNRDYFGNELYDTNAPFYKKFAEAVDSEALNLFNPMTVANWNKSGEQGGSLRDKLMGVAGFGPAPAYASRDAVQNRITHMYDLHVAPKSRSYSVSGTGLVQKGLQAAGLQAEPVGEKRRAATGQLHAALESGDTQGAATAKRALIATGIKPGTANKMGTHTSDLFQFAHLPLADQQALVREMDAGQFKKYVQQPGISGKNRVALISQWQRQQRGTQ